LAGIPVYWYNIAADLPQPLPPVIDPMDGESRIKRLTRILPSRLLEDENTLARYIRIPDRVREEYMRIGRPTPLVRAEGLERAIGVGGRVKIYYKLEALLPTGSHKLNTAIAQAYYASLDGASEVVTETGAGQWGLAGKAARRLFILVHWEEIIFFTSSFLTCILHLHNIPL